MNHHDDTTCVICDGIRELMTGRSLHGVVHHIMAEAKNTKVTVPLCPRHRRQLSAAVDRQLRAQVEANPQ
jgi:hypothetical protein